ncbi:MAG: SAM-dependent methyltransferase, partial [Pseudonocardia sediminis]
MSYDELVPDLERANAARMYDYLLGGAHNFAVDREAADRALARRADLGEVARANRRFLGRVVRRCLDDGIDQFLDLGSGVPTVGNVHEIAHAAAPDARVAYVDIEPVAVAAGRSLVAGSDLVTVTHGDLREPAAVLGAPTV